MKKIIFTIGAILLMTGLAQADLVLINDDFSSNTVATNNRFRGDHIDSGDWNVRLTDGPGWIVSGGALSNPAATTNDDKGLHLLNSIATADTFEFVTVAFDYTVGAGTTLYFSSSLFTGASAQTGNSIIAQNNSTGGVWQGTQFNDNFDLEFNLKDGSIPVGTTASAVESFVGGTSGTFSQTFDISGYTGISSIADVSHILAVFTADTAATGNGAIAIDNFNVRAISAVPEPSTFFAMTLGALCMLTTRRRMA